jgi:5-hydroxyisourate hydrolase
MISTHVLDTSRGVPAVGVGVVLVEVASGRDVGAGRTDGDGRIKELSAGPLAPGAYRLTFDTAGYAASLGRETFYPEVSIVFVVNAGERHYHVPLLLSPYGYTTYRGT